MDSMKKIENFFRSRKLAIFLISMVILLSLIGTTVPQKSQIKTDVYNAWKNTNPQQADIFEAIGFTNLFSSFIFLIIAFLLSINTAFCTWNMLKGAFRKLGSYPQFQNDQYISKLENHSVLKTEKEQVQIISEINSVLKERGYKVSQRQNCIFAHKNKLGVLGTSLFHICILVIILSVVYGTTGRMEGDMRLIEGQTLSEDHENYMFINEGPFFNEAHQGFNITLQKFYAKYNDETNTPRGASGTLSIEKDGKLEKTDIVYSNHLMNYGGYTFLGNVYGMAPLLILRDRDGKVISGSYITAQDQDESDRYVAFFNIGDTGLEGGLMVYMTTNLTSRKIMEADALQEPILFLKIFDKGSEIYNGTLKMNDTVQIDDKNLGFYDIKYWSNFYIVKDRSTMFVYAGIGSIIFSLAISLFLVPKKIWIEVVKSEKDNHSEIYIGGRADKFRSFYEEEIGDIVNRIKEKL
ncbi:MAG: cytochrome c biogenesis protein ResB [Candidatus Methanoperedens sp.]|nr:cytochrome c biogenesis protein ResB [Candidatus Methanoperedens sp.]